MDEKRLLQIHHFREPDPPIPQPQCGSCCTPSQLLTPFNRTMRPDETTEDIESFLWEFWEVVVNLSQAYDGEKSDIA
ncbi:hypothetical protein E4T47_02180 [Aureobasidium subglaciale]|nr:hypothetical protein E4T47_02180 [Aureobasidium subglaciale]